MKVFISHALTDQDILKRIKETLEPHGLQLNIAEHYEDIERNITSKIENLIIQSDIALILLTQNWFNSHFVQQEIGYIKSLKKPFIQVVQSGLEKEIRGFNYGYDYFELDPNQPNIALEKVKRRILNYWKKRRAEEAEIELQKQLMRIKNENDDIKTKLVVGGLVTLLFLGIVNSD